MKKLASLLMAALLMTMLVVPALAAPGDDDDVPSVGREEPVVIADINDMPDANAPDAPAFVVVQDPANPADEGQNFVLVDPTPDVPEDTNAEYVPEDQVPLAPNDGVDTTAADTTSAEKENKDNSGEGIHEHLQDAVCWSILAVSALIGIVLGFVIGRATKKDKDDEKKSK